VKTLQIKSLSYKNSRIGVQNTESILQHFNSGSELLIDFINMFLDDEGLEIPSKLFNGGLMFKNGYFSVRDFYLAVMVRPEINLQVWKTPT